MEKTLIENNEITPDMERIRSGNTMLFRRRGLDNKFTDEKNADVIIKAPRPELYAELIDGKWHWVNGCAECNGEPRDWTTYIECEKHNICRTCQIPRKKLEAIPQAGKHGWQCTPCADAEAAASRRLSFEKMVKKEYDEWDYHNTNNVICPHCELSYNPDCEQPVGEQECDNCGGKYSVEPEFSVTYTTKVIGERLTS